MRTAWITNELPDDEMVVLMHLADPEYPVWPGFHEDNAWHHADGSMVQGDFLGWMELETAAAILSGRQ